MSGYKFGTERERIRGEIEIATALRDELRERLSDRVNEMQAEIEALDSLDIGESISEAIRALQICAHLWNEPQALQMITDIQIALLSPSAELRADTFADIRSELDLDSPYYRGGKQ